MSQQLLDTLRTVFVKETDLRASSIDGYFEEWLKRRGLRHYSSIYHAIDKSRSVLDIGCGLAGIDAWLARAGVLDVHLLDGDGTRKKPKQKYGPSAPWGDVEAGAKIVRAAAPNARVTAHVVSTPREVEVANDTLSLSVDLIISIRSWCHHYPVDTYLKLAQRCLLPGGLLVVDVRTGTTGDAVLANSGFVRVMQLDACSKRHKCQRWLFVRG